MASIKFDFKAGALLRKSLRNMLQKLKSDVLCEEPDAVVNIDEYKLLTSSDFYVSISNISDNMAISIKSMCLSLGRM